ncbi:MAG: hypothetical protein HYU36_13025 [Planctomycetes bacterium]|nr:hypothetical protein [Planctomycetota bacterium]
MIASLAYAGYLLRAFTAWVHAVILGVSILVALLVSGPLQDCLIQGMRWPEIPVRLVGFWLSAGLTFAAGRLLAARYWTSHELFLITPVDQILGASFGAAAGLLLASAVSLACFMHPGFDAALYPPPQQLDRLQNWSGPDPALHAPYRIGQLMALVDRLTGGPGIDPGPAAAWLAAGPAGQRFYETLAFTEGCREAQPVRALEAWEQFRRQHADGRYAAWVRRAERQRDRLKPQLVQSADAFIQHVRGVLDSGDLEAVHRVLDDINQFFADVPRVLALRDLIREAEEIVPQARALAADKPSSALRLLRNLQKKFPDSILQGLLTREILALSPQGNLPAEPEPEEIEAERREKELAQKAEANARGLSEKFRFASALQVIRTTRDLLKRAAHRETLEGRMRQVETLEKLHGEAVQAINAPAGGERPLPASLGLGEGTVVSATASSVTCKLKGVLSLRSWSQIGPRGARILYVEYLGEKAEGLEEFDRFFLQEPSPERKKE